MITRMSEMFLRTLRDDPADAEVASHKLLVRAGYVRRTAPGIYTWLPLGLKVLRNIEKVVREEMEAIGAQEICLPALLPREPYEQSNRWDEYGDLLFKLKDRKGNDCLLGPTHEEMFTLLVKDMYNSYKDLPLVLFQIQTKYRDEERPRAGILRGREFIMKDSYSFDMADSGLDDAYDKHRRAYQKIFNRLGVNYAICKAMAGAMGGSRSEEFLAVSPAGEDTFVMSTDGQFAANAEAVVTEPGTPRPIEGQPEAEVRETPDCTTIEALVDWAGREDVTINGHKVTAADTLKCIVLKVTYPGEKKKTELVGVLVPGDREVDFKRLEAALEPAVAEMAEDKDFKAHDFLVKGYVGPDAFTKNGLKVYADPRVVDGTCWITGANKPGHHAVNMVCGRDFTPDGVIEAAEIKEGDTAPDGHGTLTLKRGIEIGHIFQLGRKYSEAMELKILDESGKLATPTMGSYGIGVSRLVGVIAEQTLDDKGLNWPVAVAPFTVHVVIANKDDAARQAAEELAADLSAAGLDVLLDDRPKVSPGVKFKDSELLGMPFVVVVGRGFADGTVELRRRGGEQSEIDYTAAVDTITAAVRKARS
ncbi:proline--tRNA ligase [Corynebacterium mendelii]|uniref:Proline--tRNA ligase n=1 Tax=Corynebacterium mendelii TaxID=2765362 RepID=A0A939E0J8_9CORY|nr:proline--tRNA ligase [Corynebacterium mendelii]MBN9643262.1 proline--tRNA ligase [Corynebacterium mendelii]